MNAASSRCLIVFARAPIRGTCKTRLIPKLGGPGAAKLHQQLTLRTLETASAVRARPMLYSAPDARHGFFLACRRRWDLPLHRQVAGDLGRRMAQALRAQLQTYRSALIVGTDCAALTAADIEEAFLALEQGHPTVIKPAMDGGYVLIGATRITASALRAIDWSSGRELRQTVRRLQYCGLAPRLLSPSWDIDRPRDVSHARRAGLLSRRFTPLFTAQKKPAKTRENVT